MIGKEIIIISIDSIDVIHIVWVFVSYTECPRTQNLNFKYQYLIISEPNQISFQPIEQHGQRKNFSKPLSGNWLTKEILKLKVKVWIFPI